MKQGEQEKSDEMALFLMLLLESQCGLQCVG